MNNCKDTIVSGEALPVSHKTRDDVPHWPLLGDGHHMGEASDGDASTGTERCGSWGTAYAFVDEHSAPTYWWGARYLVAPMPCALFRPIDFRSKQLHYLAIA